MANDISAIDPRDHATIWNFLRATNQRTIDDSIAAVIGKLQLLLLDAETQGMTSTMEACETAASLIRGAIHRDMARRELREASK